MKYAVNRCQVGQTRLLLGLILPFVIGACAPLRPFYDANLIRQEIKQPEQTIPVGPSEVEIYSEASECSEAFWLRPMQQPGKLPNIHVKGLSVTELGLFDVLQIIFSETNMPLSFEGGSATASRYGTVTLNNLSGPLSEVIEKLGEIMGFFWTVSDSGVLRIMPDQQFVVTMPPALGPDNLASLTNTLQYLGAKDVYPDRLNRSLVFRANRSVMKSVGAYQKSYSPSVRKAYIAWK